MKTYENYAEEDIVFVNLTEEEAPLREQVEAWARQFKIPWAVGYGAGATLKELQIPGVPTTFVIGRDGRVRWHSFLPGSLDRAIRQAL